MQPPSDDYISSSILFPENDICCHNNNHATLFPDDYYNLNYNLFFPESLPVQQNICLQEFEGFYLQFLDLFNGLPLNPDSATGLLPNVALDEAQDINNGGKRDRLGKKIVRSSKKDRHSKINTANGPRDRRMRLSLDVARKFFHLQDLLGFDKASRTVDWLLKNSGAAIRELAGSRQVSTGEDAAGLSELPSCKKTKPQRKGAGRCRVVRTVGRESRRRARERARERASQKRRLGRESNCTVPVKESSPISSRGIIRCGGSSAEEAQATAEDCSWNRTPTAPIYGCPNTTATGFQQHDENRLWNCLSFAGNQQGGK